MQNWLKEELRNNGNYCFEVFDISENYDVTDTIKSLIACELIRAFRNEKAIIHKFKDRPESELEEYFINKVFSPPERGFPLATRIGDWGEVFAGLYLQLVKSHNIPLYKLRFKDRKDKSVRLLDLLTINVDESEVCFNEVKTKTSRVSSSDYNLAHKAYEELINSYNTSEPEIYDFIIRMLENFERFEEADRLQNLFNRNQESKKPCILLIFNKNHWKDDLLTYLDNQQIDITSLCVSIFLVSNLRQLIDETYNMTVIEAKKLVYGDE